MPQWLGQASGTRPERLAVESPGRERARRRALILVGIVVAVLLLAVLAVVLLTR